MPTTQVDPQTFNVLSYDPEVIWRAGLSGAGNFQGIRWNGWYWVYATEEDAVKAREHYLRTLPITPRYPTAFEQTIWDALAEAKQDGAHGIQLVRLDGTIVRQWRINYA